MSSSCSPDKRDGTPNASPVAWMVFTSGPAEYEYLVYADEDAANHQAVSHETEAIPLYRAEAFTPSHALQNVLKQAEAEAHGSVSADFLSLREAAKERINAMNNVELVELIERSELKIASSPSTTPQKQEGEHKSLAGQAIEMAISALRDIHRRAPGTRTFFDYEAFIERELVPAMEMADKDRQGCIGLMGLLAKEKLKVEELTASAASAIVPLGAAAYVVEEDDNGCKHCHAGRSYTIVGPDGVGAGRSWEDADEVAVLADWLCDAFNRGRSAASACSDLESAVNIGLATLGHFNTEQTDKHWNAQERVLREIQDRLRRPDGGNQT